MRKMHEKSILLGIGIGMIITAIAGIIYSAGTPKELSKNEIISRAKTYGLIEPTKLLNNGNPVSDSTASASTTAKQTPGASTATPSSTQDTKKADTVKSDQTIDGERNIVITIEDGHISKEVTKQLLDKGIITSEKEFSDVINSYKASRKIISGTYKFKKNEDLDYLVKKICGIK